MHGLIGVTRRCLLVILTTLALNTVRARLQYAGNLPRSANEMRIHHGSKSRQYQQRVPGTAPL
jgi:hypothetical protein